MSLRHIHEVPTALEVIAEPRRREILDLLRDEERLGGRPRRRARRLSQPNVSKHLRVLRDAGLVTRPARRRQRRWYRVRPEPLAELDAWLAPYRRLWTGALDDLEAPPRRDGGRMTDPTMATVLEADGRVGLRFVRHLAHAAREGLAGHHRVRAPAALDALRHRRRAAGGRDDRAAVLAGARRGLRHRRTRSSPARSGCGTRRTSSSGPWDTDVLRWELVPDGDGTVLTFTTWFGEPDRAGAANAGAGYHVCLDHLVELLDTGSVAQPARRPVHRRLAAEATRPR